MTTDVPLILYKTYLLCKNEWDACCNILGCNSVCLPYYASPIYPTVPHQFTQPCLTNLPYRASPIYPTVPYQFTLPCLTNLPNCASPIYPTMPYQFTLLCLTNLALRWAANASSALLFASSRLLLCCRVFSAICLLTASSRCCSLTRNFLSSFRELSALVTWMKVSVNK